MGIFDIFKPRPMRKAIFRWTSEQNSGIIKQEFRGPFSQAETYAYVIKKLDETLPEGDVILSVEFVGIEGK